MTSLNEAQKSMDQKFIDLLESELSIGDRSDEIVYVDSNYYDDIDNEHIPDVFVKKK